MLYGIDVSANNGVINWPEVASTKKVGFAFIKATEGITVIDSQFQNNWKNARASKIICSPYHFFHPGDDPHVTAEVFLKTIGELSNTDLPATLDFEVLDQSSVKSAIDSAKTWLQIVEQATGKPPIFYSDLGFIQELQLDSSFTHYPLYQAEVGIIAPRVAKPWDQISFWQYSWTGNMFGINSNVDMDEFYGAIDQLMAIAEG